MGKDLWSERPVPVPGEVPARTETRLPIGPEEATCACARKKRLASLLTEVSRITYRPTSPTRPMRSIRPGVARIHIPDYEVRRCLHEPRLPAAMSGLGWSSAEGCECLESEPADGRVLAIVSVKLRNLGVVHQVPGAELLQPTNQRRA